MLDQCPNLKAIAKYGVGVDNIDMEYAQKKGIKVSRTIGSNSLSVAEHAMGLIFTLAKNTYSAVQDVKNGNWNKVYGFELQGKTIGIIGFGNIGKNLARLAQGMNMKVMAYDAMPIDTEYAEKNHIMIAEYEQLLKESDVISVHMPLTAETKDMIDKKAFAIMKSNAIVINAARGGIINEADLYEALMNKRIAGAGFDVFTQEPPKDSPLLKLNNFILTPHTASKTKEADDNTIRMSTANILRDLEVSK